IQSEKRFRFSSFFLRFIWYQFRKPMAIAKHQIKYYTEHTHPEKQFTPGGQATDKCLNKFTQARQKIQICVTPVPIKLKGKMPDLIYFLLIKLITCQYIFYFYFGFFAGAVNFFPNFLFKSSFFGNTRLISHNIPRRNQGSSTNAKNKSNNNGSF